MATPSKEASYKNDFEKFLSHTNEKAILYNEINRIIKARRIKSVLDIGAGNGLLSIPLARQVEKYTAIEKKPSFVEKLRSAGLDVIEGEFPLEITDEYNLVLISHALSYEKEQINSFISNAWKLVSNDGALLVITYRGEDDDWSRFMRFLGKDPISRNIDGYNELIDFVHKVGKAEIRKVTTTVETEGIDDMIEALSFVASNGIPELKNDFLTQSEKIKIFLETYHTDEGYIFPFQHFFIIASKD